MENPIKMDDMGVPLYLETPKLTCAYCSNGLTNFAFFLASPPQKKNRVGHLTEDLGKKKRIFFMQHV